MGFLSSKSTPPPVPSPVPMPRTSDIEVQERREREKRRLRGMQGRQPTILTGPQGVKGPAPVGLKSLLGE